MVIDSSHLGKMHGENKKFREHQNSTIDKYIVGIYIEIQTQIQPVGV